jgi:Tfp pilus assembly protein PilF
MRSHPVWVVALGLALVAGAPAHTRAATAAARAETLYAHAEGLLKRNQIDTRRIALRELEQATLLQPDDALYQLELARAYFACGFLKSAKQRFERVTHLAPADAEGRYGLALVWRRDWL